MLTTPVRWQKVDKHNWLDAMLAAVVDPVGAARARSLLEKSGRATHSSDGGHCPVKPPV